MTPDNTVEEKQMAPLTVFNKPNQSDLSGHGLGLKHCVWMRFCTNLCELMGGIMELFRDRCVGYVFVVDELPVSVSAVRERAGMWVVLL